MNTIKSAFVASIAGFTLFFGMSTAFAAETNSTGVLALYKASDPAKFILDKTSVEALGCKVHQKGIIGGSLGGIGLEQPNLFVLFNCQVSLLSEPSKRNSLMRLNAKGKTIAVLEGNLMGLPNAKRSSKPTDRQYIIKISHYNNRDVKTRERDLDALTREAQRLNDTYVTEAFIAVNHALGLPTPDEAVILFYNSAAEGVRFRKNNPKLLAKIGQFNKKHLVDAVYYVARLTE